MASLDLLRTVFKRVKGSTVLEKVCFGPECETACINMQDFNIKVNPDFVDSIVEEGLSEETAYEGLLNHEVGHYVFHPFNLRNNILEINSLEKNNIPLNIKKVYDDFVDNCNLILKGRDEGLSGLYKKIGCKGVVRVLGLYYQELSGEDYGCGNKPSDKEKWQVKELNSLNVLIRNGHEHQIIDFYNIFKDDSISLPSEGIDSLMKSLCDSYGKDRVGKEIKELVDKGLIDEEDGKRMMSRGGVDEGEYFLGSRLKEYIRLAEAYSISAEKVKSVSTHNVPFAPVDLSVEAIGDFDPFNSFASGGKPLPPIAKSWCFKEAGFVTGEEVSLNDLLILIDSSGSMQDPDAGLSGAVISSMALARYYIIHNSSVGVINFSNKSIVSGFSTDYEKVCESLFAYQGGGTELDVYKFKSAVNSKEVCDVVLISDEAITNYDSVINSFKQLENKDNILYIFSIDNSNKSEKEGNINRVLINKPEDIRDIVLRKRGATIWT